MAVKGTISYRITKFTARMMAATLATGIVVLYLAQPVMAWFIPGAVLVLLGEALRIWAAGHLKKNKQLTTTGPYAYVKNPLYLGTFLITLGGSAMARSVFIMLVGVTWLSLYYIPYKKRQEHRKLSESFGDTWLEYDRSVPAYIPRRTSYAGKGADGWSFSLVKENSEHETAAGVLLGSIVLLFMLVF